MFPNFTTTIFRQLRWIALVPQGDVASQTPSLDSSVQARSGPGPGPSKRWHVSGVLKRTPHPPLSHKVFLFPKYKNSWKFRWCSHKFPDFFSPGIDFLFTTFYCIHFLFFQASYDWSSYFLILAEWQCDVMARRESIPIDVPIFGDSSDSASSRCLRVERVRVKAVTGTVDISRLKNRFFATYSSMKHPNILHF